MSQADELLESMASDSGGTVGNIIIGNDRFITVPASLQKIAVQHDHNVETVTFDCPRYWDGRDLSKLNFYVNYMRPDESCATCLCDNVVVDSSDDTIVHFDWMISGHVTEYAGPLTFLVCARNIDADGNIVTHWNSELNTDMYISSGMKCHDAIVRRYPDIISQLLELMDKTQLEAGESAEIAVKSAEEALTSETNAATSEAMAESWAVGGTGLREGENTNNAKYWASQAQSIAGGDYATPAQAQEYANTAETNAKNYAKQYTDDAISEIQSGEQISLTFDDTPTKGSSNPVTSDGIVNYVDGIVGDINSILDTLNGEVV